MNGELSPQDASDLYDFVKMTETRGFQVLMANLGAERERLIRAVAGGRVRGRDKTHGWEYFQGALAEFQTVIDIIDRLRTRWEEAKSDAREAENAEQR